MRPALLLLLVAAALVALFYLFLGVGDSRVAGGLDGPSSAPIPAAGEAPVELQAAAPPEQDTRRAAPVDPVEPMAPPGALPTRPTVAHMVRVDVPAATAADESAEVIVVTRDLGLGRVLGVLDSDAPRRVSQAEEVFADLDPTDDRPEVLRAAIHGRTPLVRAADGTFRATVDVPERGAAWLLVAGTHLRTPAPAPLQRGASPQVLTAELGGALVIELRRSDEPAIAEHPLEGQRIEIRRDSSDSPDAIAGANRDRGSRVRADRLSDTRGRIEVRAVPASAALTVTAFPDAAAIGDVPVRPLAPGETRNVVVTLGPGAFVSGVVHDPAGRPIAGAEVRVLKKGKFFGFDDEEQRSGKSDAEGGFQVVGLAPGKYAARAFHADWLESKDTPFEVTVERPARGLVLSLREGRTLAGTVRFADGAPAVDVPVRARFDAAFAMGQQAMNATQGTRSETRSGADGKFELRGLGAGPFVVEAEAERPGPGGTVSWRVQRENVSPAVKDLVLTLHAPLSVHGIVVDDLGAPVPDVEVSVVRVSPAAVGQLDRRRADVRSDAAGAFRCEDLVGGDFEVVVSADTHVTVEPVRVSLPGADDGPLTIVAARAATVRGSVVSPDGARVPEAAVVVSSGSPDWAENLRKRRATPRAVSDGEGSFELVGVAPGDTALRADSKLWARSEPQALHLDPGEVREGILLRLASGGDLTGEVYDAEGQPVAGRFVQVARTDGSRQQQTQTDSAGKFSVEHLEPGTYQVVAIDLARMGASGDDAADGQVDVAAFMSAMNMAAATIVEGEVTHVVLGAPPADPVRVHGQVTQAGRSVEGAIVSFFPSGPKLYERLKVASTDAQGRYELVLDEPGDYVVAVQRQIGGLGQQSTAEFRADVPDGDDYEQDLELPGGRISGRVVDDEGRAAAGARVSLSVAGGVRTDQLLGGNTAEVTADGEGRFTLEGLRPARYRLAAGGGSFLGGEGAAFGRVVREDLVLATDGAIDDLVVRLPRPGSIAVTCRGTDGAVRADVTVFVRDEHGAPLETMALQRTDSSGRVVLHGIAPGRYTVSARGRGEAAGDGPFVKVTAGDTVETQLALEAGTVLRVQLTVSGDGEVPSATVEVLDAAGRDMGGMLGMTDLQDLYLEGGFSRTQHKLGPLPPGRYTIRASGALEGERRVTLRGEPERSVQIVLK